MFGNELIDIYLHFEKRVGLCAKQRYISFTLEVFFLSLMNKTKYFCSDSMMKYALREGFERAKKELRKSKERTKRHLREN